MDAIAKGRGFKAQHGATSGMMPRLLTTVWMIGLVLLIGCNSPLIRSQSPEAERSGVSWPTTKARRASVELVGDLTVPMGLNYQKIEGVGWSTGWTRPAVIQARRRCAVL